MSVAYLAALIPIIWVAILFWALSRPRNVHRPLTEEEIRQRLLAIATSLATFYAIELAEAMRMVNAAMATATVSTRRFGEAMEAVEGSL